MPVLQVQDEFQSGDNVTASTLNDLVNDASFVSGAVDNSTLQVASAGHLKVKDNGILSNHLKSDATNDSVRAVTTNHIRNDAVTNDKIADLAVGTDQIASDAVTYAKIQNVSATDRVLGRKSTGAGNVEEISPLDLRTMINVENGATADQTDAEIKTAYENNDDTNAFTNAEKIKLSGIEANATADQTASEIKTAYESNDDTNAFTDAEKNKLSEIETGATADQTDAEIKTAYENNTNTNAFTDSEKNKLTGIAAGAEVNVQSDWTATTGDAFIKNKPTIPTNNNQLTNGAGYTTNTGTVTSIATGTGLSGGTITSSGTIALDNTTVIPGTYTNTNLTVDAQGRITAASSGSAGSTTYDSGWVDDSFFVTPNGGLLQNTTYNFAHGFTHLDFMVDVYLARILPSVDSANAHVTRVGDSGVLVGINSTNIVVTTSTSYTDAFDGISRTFGTGNNSNWPNWAWLRVVARTI